MSALDRAFEDIQVGDTASFSRTFTTEDIQTFANLTGDHNPLHEDEAYAGTTRFKKPIAHGMLTASLISTLLGMHLPGKRCLILTETLSFHLPVYPEEVLDVSGTVTQKSEATRILEIDIHIRKEGKDVVSGSARVQLI